MEITKEMLLKCQFLNVREAAEEIGTTKARVYYYANKYGLSKMFGSKDANRLPKKILLIDKYGKAKPFDSMSDATTFLSVRTGSLSYHLDRGTIYRGYSVVSHKTEVDPLAVAVEGYSCREGLKRRKIKKILFWNEEMEMTFRKLGYYQKNNK